MTDSEADHRVVIRRQIAATPEELYDAWLDPEGMKAWMCPGDVISTEVQLDPRVGGSIVITMHGPAEVHESRGEFQVLERPSKLAFTWNSKGTDGEDTLLTVEFTAVNADQTELVLTHERFPRSEKAADHRRGWGQIVGRLEQYLAARSM